MGKKKKAARTEYYNDGSYFTKYMLNLVKDAYIQEIKTGNGGINLTLPNKVRLIRNYTSYLAKQERNKWKKAKSYYG